MNGDEPMILDDAVQFVVRYSAVNEPRATEHDFGGGDYDIRLNLIARDYFAESGIREHDLSGAVNRPELDMEIFFAAACELPGRGVLRPGANSFGSHTTAWSGGTGYSVTPYGERWIKEADEVDLMQMQPGRFAEILSR